MPVTVTVECVGSGWVCLSYLCFLVLCVAPRGSKMTYMLGFCFAPWGIRLPFLILTTLHVIGILPFQWYIDFFKDFLFSHVMEFGLCRSRLR